jgi:hypothetical protein
MKRELCTAEIEAWELGEARLSHARIAEEQRRHEATSLHTLAIVFGVALPLLIAGVIALVRFLVRS